MCPEFEREEREFQKNVDRWEMVCTLIRVDMLVAHPVAR